MKAHQRVVREDMADFDPVPDGVGDVPISDAVVRPIERRQSQRIIERYEWLGKMAAVNFYYFGIFFGRHLAGTVVYGQEYIENLGHWDKYGYTGKIILLNRGACVHWAHPHSASKLIRNSMKMLPERYKVVTATVDDMAGEVGTIYQACNFDFIGSMRDNNPNVNSSKGDRSAWIIDGQMHTARNLRQKYGTTRMEVLQQYHPDVKRVRQNSKGRYFAFLGSKREKRDHRKAISEFIKPYPKRTDTTTKPVTLCDGVKRGVPAFTGPVQQSLLDLI